jgi:hypothetical protein
VTEFHNGDSGGNDREAKAARLNRLLNDPDVQIEPDAIGAMLAELKEAAGGPITLAPLLSRQRTQTGATHQVMI